MDITVIGAGNSGLAMAAHLCSTGNRVALWNRSISCIRNLMDTNIIKCEGVLEGEIVIDLITNDIKQAVDNSDVILITTPANSHKELAHQLARHVKKDTLIVLNPGRTFGALEFLDVFRSYNKCIKNNIAETQTIIYTCRKTSEDSVNIIALKNGVLISTISAKENEKIILRLPISLQPFFIPARSMIETSIGNVGMILHCAPLLLNTGWTESKDSSYRYYYDGITPSVGKLIEKIDEERISVSNLLGIRVETTMEWLKRTYHVKGENLFECIQSNEAYKTIDAPSSLKHRYILEDVPFGLVPLESVGKALGLLMKHTSIIIDLASSLLDIDFRNTGRNFLNLFNKKSEKEIIALLKGR